MKLHSEYNLPPDFIQYMKGLLGKDSADLFDSLETEAPVSIRLNPYKPVIGPKYDDVVPWSNNGYYLESRPSFTLDPLFHGGAYYVQEAASMFVNFAIRQYLNTELRPLRILDLCAAPGGKSSLLTELGAQHLYVSNEIIKSRFNILSENLTRWGMTNRILTQHDARDFADLKGCFDLILVDAPCSGEGMFRKDKRSRSEWSKDNVLLCQGRQRRILGNVYKLLAPDGLLVYSTCTFNTLENEDNVEWLQDNFDLESLDLQIEEEWGIQKSINSRVNGFRFYPDHTRSEGLFLSLLRGKGNKAGKFKIRNSKYSKASKSQRQWLEKYVTFDSEQTYFVDESGVYHSIGQHHFEFTQKLIQTLPRVKPGLILGKEAKKELIPSHDLAMSHELKLEYPEIEVNKADALRFLKKESFEFNGDKLSWHRVTYKGVCLGWVKILKDRMNNYLPKSSRILMDVDFDAFE